MPDLGTAGGRAESETPTCNERVSASVRASGPTAKILGRLKKPFPFGGRAFRASSSFSQVPMGVVKCPAALGPRFRPRSIRRRGGRVSLPLQPHFSFRLKVLLPLPPLHRRKWLSMSTSGTIRSLVRFLCVPLFSGAIRSLWRRDGDRGPFGDYLIRLYTVTS